MKEDEILAQVRDHVRTERANDAALEAVARGENASAEVAELERRAATDPEIAAALNASRPLGADVEARIVARISAHPNPNPNPMGKADTKGNASTKGNGNAKGSANANGNATARANRIVPFARRIVVVAGPLALAAGLVVYVAMGGRATDGHALLPEYTIAASSEQAMRGAQDRPAPELRLRGGPDAAFEILARPATVAGEKIVAYVFAIGEGEPNAVEANVEVANGGAVRIRGRARALDGARELRVVIGTGEGSIKRYEDALSRARERRSDASVRVLSVAVVRD